MAEELFSKVAPQFHLVGQSQGPVGRNVFEGGFLGLDNIGVFDRSAPAAHWRISRAGADGTAWMALYCQNMLEISSELAMDRSRTMRRCR
jgi:hypothetical protein